MIWVIAFTSAVFVGECTRSETKRRVFAAAVRRSKRAEIVIARSVLLAQNHHVLDLVVRRPTGSIRQARSRSWRHQPQLSECQASGRGARNKLTPRQSRLPHALKQVPPTLVDVTNGFNHDVSLPGCGPSGRVLAHA